VFFGAYTKKVKNVFLIVVGMLLLSIILSAFTATFIMALGIFYFYFIFSRNISFKSIFVHIFILSLISGILIVVGSGALGGLGGTAGKFHALNSILFEQDFSVENLNFVTSNRWRNFSKSFESFFSSPICGLGYYNMSIARKTGAEYVLVSYGHSSVINGLAYFGILSIPMIMIYVSFFITTFQVKNMYLKCHPIEIKKYSLIAAIFLSFILLGLVNPYYFRIFDSILYLLGGFVFGKKQLLKSRF
jgi:hypothetical protein